MGTEERFTADADLAAARGIAASLGRFLRQPVPGAFVSRARNNPKLRGKVPRDAWPRWCIRLTSMLVATAGVRVSLALLKRVP
jgi:hypothetical protein